MPASLPGDTLANALLNPNAGRSVNFDLLSGPKGSPFDNDNAENASTGALSTGIGVGCLVVNDPESLAFAEDYIPGETLPDGTLATISILMYIGGGGSDATLDGESPLAPYSAGFGIGNAGNGGSRDAGAGPAFTGFLSAFSVADTDTANGADLGNTFINRSGVEVAAGQYTFGSSLTASATVA